MMSTAARDAVYGAIQKLNTKKSFKRSLNADDNTPLTGPSAALDSIELVDLLVAIEDAYQNNKSQTLELTNIHGGALKTVGSLVLYIEKVAGT